MNVCAESLAVSFFTDNKHPSSSSRAIGGLASVLRVTFCVESVEFSELVERVAAGAGSRACAGADRSVLLSGCWCAE